MSELTPSYEESYVLDRTRAYHNLLQNKIINKGKRTVQSYAWDFNTVFMEENERDFTYLQDEMGSVVRLLEAGNEGQTIYGYDEFGNDTYGTQGRIQPFGYTGYRYDKVANTYFAQAREYVAGVGRFAGEDWVKGEIGYPTSLNQYGYCYENPEKFVDLDGKSPTILIGAGIGAAFGFIGGVGSEIVGVVSGNQKNINWKNVLVDTTSGMAVGAMAGTGVGIAVLVAGGAAVGAANYTTKTTLNNEWESKSVQEHLIDGAISTATWAASAAAGGTMTNDVKNIAINKANIAEASLMDNLQRSMSGSGWASQWKSFAIKDYQNYIKHMTLASGKTNFLATGISFGVDIGMKSIKDKVYKKRVSDMSSIEFRNKLRRHIKRPTKVGKCFIE